MPTNFNIDQLESKISRPIVLLEAVDEATGKTVQLTVRDLPLAAILTIVQFINQHNP